jgi:Lactonase, 7-bladed beta-propeller
MSRYTRGIVIFIAVLMTAAPAAADHFAPTGAVYAMTNGENGNEITVFDRAADGTLTLAGSVATGGNGATSEVNDALGSQNPLILSPDNHWLLAVNAGSDQISVLKVLPGGLAPRAVVPSGGEFPVSLAMHGHLLYVLNAGNDGNITGFYLGPNGFPIRLPGSTRGLDAGGSNPPFFIESPAQVGFSPSGDRLVVSVKGTHPVHQIHVYGVNFLGLPSKEPVTTTSATTLSFGFVFTGFNRLLVAEPFGDSLGPGVPPPVPDAGAVSSYRIRPDRSLVPISASVLNAQTATCWIVVTGDRRFAYTTNNVANTISSYRVNGAGNLILIAAQAADTGNAPVDLGITPDSRYLYNVNTADGTVGMYRIDGTDGSLTFLGTVGGLPADGTAVGIAVR